MSVLRKPVEEFCSSLDMWEQMWPIFCSLNFFYFFLVQKKILGLQNFFSTSFFSIFFKNWKKMLHFFPIFEKKNCFPKISLHPQSNLTSFIKEGRNQGYIFFPDLWFLSTGHIFSKWIFSTRDVGQNIPDPPK